MKIFPGIYSEQLAKSQFGTFLFMKLAQIGAKRYFNPSSFLVEVAMDAFDMFAHDLGLERGRRVNCAHACHCSCHDSDGLKKVHIAPCCSICPVCSGWVVFADNHLKECHPDYKCSGM